MGMRRASSTYDWVYEEIGNRVRFYRTRQKMNQENLAQMLGLTRASIANLETGRQRVPIHTVYAIAEALKVEVVDLLDPKQGELAKVKQDALCKLSDEEKAALGLIA